MREKLYEIFKQEGFKVGAEIGVQSGINSLLMFKTIPGLKLYLVDSWSPNKKFDAHRAYLRTLKRVLNYNAIIMIGKSEDVVSKIEDKSLDFVYLDADHNYDAVMLDIIMWSGKIKNGGIMSGHDYRRNRFGVKSAVDDYSRYHNLEVKFPGGRNWYWKM